MGNITYGFLIFMQFIYSIRKLLLDLFPLYSVLVH
jgi:hypothetical protein